VSDRTFRLTSPLMQGRDVAHFQQVLNERHDDFKIRFRLDVDGQYGGQTREATQRILYGLGIPLRRMDHGVAPELRTAIRHPDRRTAAQIQLAESRKDWLRRARKRFDGHGPAGAVAYARKHIGVKEHPANSNRGPKIDQWQRMCGIGAAPWCGCFVNACLVAAGFSSQPWLRYCPWIEARARSGEGGWSWHPIGNARRGDLVLFGAGIAQHVELYIGGGQTIGGNTSSGNGGSQDNGGAVCLRQRNFSTPGFPARGVARPPYNGR
jgi:NlpC/P60 family